MSRAKKEYRTYSRENYDRFLRENNISEIELTYQKYCKNLEVCNWMFIEYALRTGEKVPLPHGFGPIAVNKRMLKKYKIYKGVKYVNLRVDWGKTNKIGKRVFHTNEHSDGYNFKWIWFNKEARLHLSELYVFRPGRYPSRAISKYIKKPNAQFQQLYLEWLNNKYYN